MRETNLSVSVKTLLKREKIESDRIEFKSDWNPDSIYRSICAFANHTKNARRYIAPLEAVGLIEKTLPDKPTSPKQRYKITTKGIRILSSLD